VDRGPSIQEIPADLDDLIDYRWPDALMVGATAHGESTYTLYILDLDYSYSRHLACLSDDGRWTISPR
jgi:hypothetical protein